MNKNRNVTSLYPQANQQNNHDGKDGSSNKEYSDVEIEKERVAMLHDQTVIVRSSKRSGIQCRSCYTPPSSEKRQRFTDDIQCRERAFFVIKKISIDMTSFSLEIFLDISDLDCID